MRLSFCLLTLAPSFLTAWVIPQISFGPDVNVNNDCAESKSRSPQQLVLDALDYTDRPPLAVTRSVPWWITST